jgi:hypothetical protein
LSAGFPIYFIPGLSPAFRAETFQFFTIYYDWLPLVQKQRVFAFQLSKQKLTLYEKFFSSCLGDRSIAPYWFFAGQAPKRQSSR